MSTATKGEIQRLLENHRPGDAQRLCKSLCRKNKKDAEAWFLLGSAYAQTGDLEGAIQSLKRSIALNSKIAITHNNLGLVYQHANRPVQACSCFEKALKLEPDSVSTLFNLGNARRAARQLDGAETAYRKALQLQPALPGVLNNLGITLYEKGALKEAERCLLRSLELDAKQINAYINLSKAFRDQRKVAKAEQLLGKALQLYPEKPEIHWDLSLVLLELGKFRTGWKEYEWRLKASGTRTRNFPLPKWTGQDIANSSILVTAEQGIGDEIMFASCIPDLIDRARQVIIDCEPRLAPLFSRSFPKALVHSSHQTGDISWLEQIPKPDFHISAGSLPQYFRNDIGDFPAHRGYLTADTGSTRKWLHRYSKLDGKYTVGISWRGGHVSQAMRRSSSIEDWSRLLKLPDINFINLQYGETDEDIRIAGDLFGVKIHDWEDTNPLENMDQFAAQIAALDLVISVDNSTVHLAGALGKQTWVLQPFCPDWRWMEQSENSYWYPGIRQFHPDTPGGWDALTNRVANNLADNITKGTIRQHGK